MCNVPEKKWFLARSDDVYWERDLGSGNPVSCRGAKYDPACDDNGDGVVEARDLRLVWFTVDGGAATLQGVSGYQLLATAGQPDAGTLAGSGYTLSGGFLVRAAPLAGFAVFLPIILRK